MIFKTIFRQHCTDKLKIVLALALRQEISVLSNQCQICDHNYQARILNNGRSTTAEV